MLAGAVQQYLKAQGLTPVYVAAFGDYTATLAYAVRAESRTDVELNGGAYEAGLQLRTRAANIIAAENAGGIAMNHLLNADGQTLFWDDPTGPAGDKSYLLEAISIVNRPTWFPTTEPGEETSANFSLFVTEV